MKKPTQAIAATRNRWLFFSVLAGLLARLGVLLVFRDGSALGPGILEPLGDQGEYLGLARSILDGDGFSLASRGQPIAEPYLYRPPLYPLALSLLLWTSGGNLAAVRVAQLSLTLLHIPLFARLSDHFRLGHKTRKLGLLLVATNPFLAYFGLFLTSDWLFQLLLAAGIVWFLRTPLEKRTLVVSAVFLGAAAMTRGEAWYISWCLILLFFFLKPSMRRLRAGLLFLVIFLGCLTPWTVRNFVHFGRWVPVQEGIIENAVIATYSPLWTGVDWPGYEEWEEETRSVAVGLPPEEAKEFLRRETLEFFGSHPRTFLKVSTVKALHLWSLWPASAFHGDPESSTPYQGKSYLILSLLGFALYVPFFVLGLWVLAHRPTKDDFLFILLVFCLNLAIGILANPDIRIRSQLHLLIMGVAFLGMDALVARFRARFQNLLGADSPGKEPTLSEGGAAP